jgi:LmbE family N-acetylglucosaminyl deacetylase
MFSFTKSASTSEHDRRLLAVLAHPDDEALALGGTLVKYAQAQVATYLVTATRGERGWFGPPDENPGPAALGRIRTAELSDAARQLGLREVNYLGYIDGEVDQAEPATIISRIVAHVRRLRPQVVVTFDPTGIYGHPDHIAIAQFTTAAVAAAANPAYRDPERRPPHQVAKLYYRAFTAAELAVYESAIGRLVMGVDGEERRSQGWEPWAVTTCIDTGELWSKVWAAVACHRSQLPGYEKLAALDPHQHRAIWGCQTFYRAMSLVNGGRALEQDLFAGLPTTQSVYRYPAQPSPSCAQLRPAPAAP